MMATAHCSSARRRNANLAARRADQPRMTVQDTSAEIAAIIAEAALLPLQDAAYAVWRRRYRLDTLERRPTADQVRAFRAMSPPEQAAKMRHDRDYAQDGPAFTHLKAAQPRASDAEIKQAIIAAVRFEDACFKYFVQDSTDYWDRCVRAVARAAKQSPFYLESAYQQARNDVAYYMK
ncbi:hypothetical protein [Bradyrhizobium lablabi]|uniref:hypothetical protein n=1 Tax=Bradyrhizobium lablabi TaxID=722472 RepID=UPI001FCCCB85|nr:hypothetical protein [Bradyrhizobium lablabi]